MNRFSTRGIRLAGLATDFWAPGDWSWKGRERRTASRIWWYPWGDSEQVGTIPRNSPTWISWHRASRVVFRPPASAALCRDRMPPPPKTPVWACSTSQPGAGQPCSALLQPSPHTLWTQPERIHVAVQNQLDPGKTWSQLDCWRSSPGTPAADDPYSPSPKLDSSLWGLIDRWVAKSPQCANTSPLYIRRNYMELEGDQSRTAPEIRLYWMQMLGLWVLPATLVRKRQVEKIGIVYVFQMRLIPNLYLPPTYQYYCWPC